MEANITKYSFATPYTDSNSEEAKVAVVILQVNFVDKTFTILTGRNNTHFCFPHSVSKKYYNLWLAVMESMKKATEFAISILGYDVVKTEEHEEIDTLSMGVATPEEEKVLLRHELNKIDPRSRDLIYQTIVYDRHLLRKGDTNYTIKYLGIKRDALLDDLFRVPRIRFHRQPGLGRNTMKHIKNIFEEHGKTFK